MSRVPAELGEPARRQLGFRTECDFASATISRVAVLPGTATADIQRLKIELLVDFDRSLWRHT